MPYFCSLSPLKTSLFFFCTLSDIWILVFVQEGAKARRVLLKYGHSKQSKLLLDLIAVLFLNFVIGTNINFFGIYDIYKVLNRSIISISLYKINNVIQFHNLLI